MIEEEKLFPFSGRCDMESKKRSRCSLFNWFQCLIQLSITVSIAIYTVVEDSRLSSTAENNREKDLEIASLTRQSDLYLQDDQQKEDLIRNYIEYLSDLLTKPTINLNESSVKFSIRLKTLSVLRELDPIRRTFLIWSLIEAQLVTYDDQIDQSLRSPLIELSDSNLTGIDLTNQRTRETFLYCLAFDRLSLYRSSFRHSHLSGSTFINSMLDEADFSFTVNHYLREICPNQTNMRSYWLSFSRSEMTSINMSYARLTSVDFSFARMDNADLTEIQLTGNLLFSHSILNRARLDRCRIFDGRILFGSAEMNEVTAQSSRLSQISFTGVQMTNCSLINAQINDSTFSQSAFTSCQMSNVRLTGVTFLNSDLSNVNFTNLFCSSSCAFRGSNLTNSIFHNATILNSNLKNARFSPEQLNQMRSLNGSTLPNGTVSA